MVTEEVQMDKWYEFYKGRVNSSYQQYFEERYKVMIGLIKELNIETIKEEGIGIGSLCKALYGKVDFRYVGTDLSSNMLKLCEQNLPNQILLYRENILKTHGVTRYDLVVGHGVLEHFNDEEIKKIWNRQTTIGSNVIHYVPLDRYQCPSFGDERLMPYEYWLELVEPFDYVLFNNGHDLLLIN